MAAIDAVRVLMLSEYFPDEIRPSRGIFVLEQAKEINKLGDVTIVAPVASPIPRKKFRSIRQINSRIPHSGTLAGVEVLRPRYFDWPRLGNYLNAYSMLLAVWRCWLWSRRECDVIHAHFACPAGYTGALLARMLKKPLVLTVHGSDINVWARYAPNRRRTVFALKMARRIIAVSSDLKAQVVAMGIPEQNVATVYNGVDIGRFKPMDVRLARSRMGLPSAEPQLLFVGNLHAVKGARFLINACAELSASEKPFHLLIVGDGPLRKQLEDVVQRLGLSERVTFAGERPHDEIPWWMNSCDVFVLPSLSEGFGIVSLEALACGKPVVATNVGGLPEIISNTSLGLLVEPADSSQLAQAIDVALDRRWDTSTLVDHACQYSWEHAAYKIHEQYELVS